MGEQVVFFVKGDQAVTVVDGLSNIVCLCFLCFVLQRFFMCPKCRIYEPSTVVHIYQYKLKRVPIGSRDWYFYRSMNA